MIFLFLHIIKPRNMLLKIWKCLNLFLSYKENNIQLLYDKQFYKNPLAGFAPNLWGDKPKKISGDSRSLILLLEDFYKTARHSITVLFNSKIRSPANFNFSMTKLFFILSFYVSEHKVFFNLTIIVLQHWFWHRINNCC